VRSVSAVRSASVADQLASGAAIRGDALDALRELDPLDDLRRPFDDYLALREENLEITRAAVEAAERGDREAIDVTTGTL